MVTSKLRLASALALAATTMFSGCTTACRFDTNAPGAKLYLDGVLKGVMPCVVELDDSVSAYTVRAEHPDYEMTTTRISQVYAGTMTSQQTDANVVASTSTHVVTPRTASTTTVGAVNQTTRTQSYAVYAWPSGFLIKLNPRSVSGATAQGSSTWSSSAAFCSKCGTRFDDGAVFCSRCGTRR